MMAVAISERARMDLPNVALAAGGRSRGMRCPRCRVATLQERHRLGIPVDVCTNCRGLWLDAGELEQLLRRSVGTGDRRSGLPARELRRADRAACDVPPAGPTGTLHSVAFLLNMRAVTGGFDRTSRKDAQ